MNKDAFSGFHPAVNLAFFLAALGMTLQIWSALNWKTDCPLTLSDGRNQLTDWAQNNILTQTPERSAGSPKSEPLITLDEVWFRYEKDTPDILKSVSMKAYPGELLCILGGNGTGKSTMLSILSGVREPYRGKYTCKAVKVAALPQNPQMLLVKKNVREELLSAFPGKSSMRQQTKSGKWRHCAFSTPPITSCFHAPSTKRRGHWPPCGIAMPSLWRSDMAVRRSSSMAATSQ